jgi:hypothetical protein
MTSAFGRGEVATDTEPWSPVTAPDATARRLKAQCRLDHQQDPLTADPEPFISL